LYLFNINILQVYPLQEIKVYARQDCSAQGGKTSKSIPRMPFPTDNHPMLTNTATMFNQIPVFIISETFTPPELATIALGGVATGRKKQMNKKQQQGSLKKTDSLEWPPRVRQSQGV